MSNPLSRPAALLRCATLHRPARRTTRTLRRSVALLAALGLVVTVLADPAGADPATGRGAYGAVPYRNAVVHSPFGLLDQPVAAGAGIRMSGWAIDPDSRSPVTVDVYVDGRAARPVTANLARTDITQYAGYGAGHGFALNADVASGLHTVCVKAVNIGAGPAFGPFGCRRVQVAVNPYGYINSFAPTYNQGLVVTGWAADSDTTSPLTVTLAVDGRTVSSFPAGLPRPDVARAHPIVGANHGFAAAVRGLAQGTHRVCITAANAGPGITPPSVYCATATVATGPVGGIDAIPRPAGSKTITVSGYAVDPDTSAGIYVAWTLDGRAQTPLMASRARAGYRAPFDWIAGNHGFWIVVPVDNAAHTVCAVAKNAGPGADRSLGCTTSPAMTATPPSAPLLVATRGGVGTAHITWSPPANSGGAPITNYVMKVSTQARSFPIPTVPRSVYLNNLPGGNTTFTIRAVNVMGGGAATVSQVTYVSPSPVAPQRTPPLISTSRYIRNITGDNAADRAKTFAMGATDAANNPSGHRYLILLQIGGQNTTGVVLSATSTYVSYHDTVLALDAYLDGYHSRQGFNAPATIAIGTNNDMYVGSATGALWATQMVNPVYNYAKRYANISVAGANDIEPGFIGTPNATMAWVRAYLANTPTQFVFNGSADGCDSGQINGGCNNGWNARVLQYVSSGASPQRILSLPQIYNNTMAYQWKYISLTGVLNRSSRVNFAGPLTEWTACYAQGYGCGSLPNHDAWSVLWAAITSDYRTTQTGLPYGTDLRVN